MSVSLPNPLSPGAGRDLFLRRYWQRKPLLLRQAWPGFQALLSREALFELAMTEDAEARLVVREGESWDVQHGPFGKRDFPALRRKDWTLLVQGVNLLDDAVAALLERFRFIPDARLDDVMISWASDGGGVGPHVDDYDVFLLQAQGTRRWRIGPVPDPRMRPGQPLKLLAAFEPDQEFVVEPGDILYLPPGWGHDGVAEGECMTYSVGFRAPPSDELLRQLLWKLADELPSGARYADRGAVGPEAASHPARLPDGMVDFLQQAFARLKPGRAEFAVALGELLTEPKQQVVFEPAHTPRLAQALARRGVALDRRSRMLYTTQALLINGEAVEPTLARSALLRRLADQRRLEPEQWAGASETERAVMLQWCRQGWAAPARAAAGAGTRARTGDKR